MTGHQLLQGVRRWAPINAAATYVTNRICFHKRVALAGQHVTIPSLCGTRCVMSEPWMTALLRILLGGRSGTFVDVGVNLGQTLLKVKALDGTRRYVGFEPNPTCIHYLSRLISANRFSDCTLCPVGLWTEDALRPLLLFSGDRTDPAASMVQEFRATEKVRDQVWVPVFRFEQVAPLLHLGSVAIIKIDVEGAELEVLHSLRSCLEAERPVVLVEILPVYTEGNVFRKERQAALLAYLAEIRYSLFRVEKSEQGDFLGATHLTALEVHGDRSKSDYILLPAEEAETLSAALHAPAATKRGN